MIMSIVNYPLHSGQRDDWDRAGRRDSSDDAGSSPPLLWHEIPIIMLQGFQDTAQEAGCLVTGGQTVIKISNANDYISYVTMTMIIKYDIMFM